MFSLQPRKLFCQHFRKHTIKQRNHGKFGLEVWSSSSELYSRGLAVCNSAKCTEARKPTRKMMKLYNLCIEASQFALCHSRKEIYDCASGYGVFSQHFMDLISDIQKSPFPETPCLIVLALYRFGLMKSGHEPCVLPTDLPQTLLLSLSFLMPSTLVLSRGLNRKF